MKKVISDQQLRPFSPTEGVAPAFIVKGSPREMGYQYGCQFVSKLTDLSVVIKASVFGTPFTTAMYGFEPPQPDKAKKDMQALMYIAEKYCPQYMEWIYGVQSGCKDQGFEIEIEDLMMVATYPDERWARPGGKYPEGFDENASNEGSTSPRPYCNGFAAAGDATKDEAVFVGVSGSPSDETPDRVMLIGYNEDGSFFSTFGTVNNPFGQAGISSKGFAFAMTSNTSETACDWGMSPEMACFYFASQCGSAAECREWLEKVPRSFATGNFLFADTEGDICVCETNNAHFNLRKPGDAGEEGNYVVSTNHFAAKETFDFNVPEMEMWKEDSVCRLATISKYLARGIEQGGVDINWINHLLRQHDWFDPHTGEWHYNEPASARGSDVLEYTHSAFFNPKDMTAFYMQGTGGGIGVPAGSMGEFVQIPLLPDAGSVCELMMMDAFFGCYHVARGEYLRVLESSKSLRQDYASQKALVELLDESYRNYEKGLNRWAYGNQYLAEGGDEAEGLRRLSEAITCFGKAQVYAKKLISQLAYYEE